MFFTVKLALSEVVAKHSHSLARHGLVGLHCGCVTDASVQLVCYHRSPETVITNAESLLRKHEQSLKRKLAKKLGSEPTVTITLNEAKDTEVSSIAFGDQLEDVGKRKAAALKFAVNITDTAPPPLRPDLKDV